MRRLPGEGDPSRERERSEIIAQVRISRGNDGRMIGKLVTELPHDLPLKLCLFENGQRQPAPGTEMVVRILRDTNPREYRKGAYIVEIIREAEEVWQMEASPSSPVLFGVSKLRPVKYNGIIKVDDGRGGVEQGLPQELRRQFDENEVAYSAALARLREEVKGRIPPDEEIPPTGLRIATPDIQENSTLEVSVYITENGVYRHEWRYHAPDGSVAVENLPNGGAPVLIYSCFKEYGKSSSLVASWQSAVERFGRPQVEKANAYKGDQSLVACWNFNGRIFKSHIVERTFADGSINILPADGAEIMIDEGSRAWEQFIDLREIGVDEPWRAVIARAEFASTDSYNRGTDILINPATLTSFCPTVSRTDVGHRLQQSVHTDRATGDFMRSALTESRKTKIYIERDRCTALGRVLVTLKTIPADQFCCQFYRVMSFSGQPFEGYAVSSIHEPLHSLYQFHDRTVPEIVVKLMEGLGGELTKDHLLRAITQYTESLPEELGKWRPGYVWQAEPSSIVYGSRAEEDISQVIESFFEPIKVADIESYQALVDQVEEDILKPQSEAVAREAERQRVEAAQVAARLAQEEGERQEFLARTKELTTEERATLTGQLVELRAMTQFLGALSGVEAAKMRIQLPRAEKLQQLFNQLLAERVDKTLANELRSLRDNVDNLVKRRGLATEHQQLSWKIQELLKAIKSAEQMIRENDILSFIDPTEEVVQKVVREFLEALPAAMANDQTPSVVLDGVIEKMFE